VFDKIKNFDENSFSCIALQTVISCAHANSFNKNKKRTDTTALKNAKAAITGKHVKSGRSFTKQTKSA